MYSPPFGLLLEDESLSDEDKIISEEDPCQITTVDGILQWTGIVGGGICILAAAPTMAVTFLGIWSIGIGIHIAKKINCIH